MENSGYCHMELEEGMKQGTLEKAEQVDAQEKSISKALVSAVASSKISRETELFEQLDL